MSQNKLPRSYLPPRIIKAVMFGTVSFGALEIISAKQQDDVVQNASTGQLWNHPFLQGFNMFVGEFLCLILYVILTKYSPGVFNEDEVNTSGIHIKEGSRNKVHIWLALIPSILEIINCSLEYASLSLINQSIYVMMRGGIPIATAGLSVIFLGTVLLRHEIVGLLLAVLGIIVVGLTQYLNGIAGASSAEAAQNDINTGIMCVLLSLLMSSMQMTVEEKIMKEYQITPLKLIGLEGFWGLILSTIAIFATSLIPCSYVINGGVCQSNGYVEAPWPGYSTVFGSSTLLMWVMIDVFAVAGTNSNAATVTKNLSALSTAILVVTTDVVVWLAGLIFNGETFYVVQLLGFIMLVTGCLLYEKVIVIKQLMVGNEDILAGDAPDTTFELQSSRATLDVPNRALQNSYY